MDQDREDRDGRRGEVPGDTRCGDENGKPKEADICVAKGIGFGWFYRRRAVREALAEYANLDLAPGEGIVKMTSIEAASRRCSWN